MQGAGNLAAASAGAREHARSPPRRSAAVDARVATRRVRGTCGGVAPGRRVWGLALRCAAVRGVYAAQGHVRRRRRVRRTCICCSSLSGEEECVRSRRCTTNGVSGAEDTEEPSTHSELTHESAAWLTFTRIPLQSTSSTVPVGSTVTQRFRCVYLHSSLIFQILNEPESKASVCQAWSSGCAASSSLPLTVSIALPKHD